MSNSFAVSENSEIVVRRIRARLVERGSSLNAWAKDHGYGPRTVHLAVRTWAGRTDRHPHGGTSRRIMDDLRRELGSEVVPEVIPGRRTAA